MIVAASGWMAMSPILLETSSPAAAGSGCRQLPTQRRSARQRDAIRKLGWKREVGSGHERTSSGSWSSSLLMWHEPEAPVKRYLTGR
jgi:hypothetical protein